MICTTIRLGDVDLECHELGKGEPLLFLHGGRGFFEDDDFVEPLSRGRRLIVPSHPGFGNSSLPDWIDCVSDIATLYLALLDHLDLPRIDVVGCSIGGWIAAEMGVMAPGRINRLVLAAPVGVKTGPVDKLDLPDIYAMSQDDLAAMFYHDAEKGRLDPTAVSDERLTTLMRNRETMALITWEPYMHNTKLKHMLFRLNAPTLMLRGASDGFVSERYLDAYADLLPNAAITSVAQAGHDIAGEQPEVFVNHVHGFLSRAEQIRAAGE